jgi:DNA-binding response OmpR family regulator
LDKILLALKAEEDVKVFTENLGSSDFEFIVATNGASAVEAAVNDPPALIVADIDLPVVSGEKLFKIFRSSSFTSKVPFLLISDTPMELKGLRAETDTILTRPFNPEEASGRIRQVLLLSSGRWGGEGELAGKLSQMGLPDIIQFLNMNKKEGELKVTGDGVSGVLYIKDGEIYNVVLGNIEKEKALYRLFGWADGEFEFVSCPVQVLRKIHSSSSGLLMEGMRQLDELKKNTPFYPDRRSLVTLTVDEGTVKKDVAPEILEIIKLLKLYSKLGDLVDNSTSTDFEVFDALMTMLSMGIVDVKPDAQEEVAGLFSIEECLKIREGIISRFPDIANRNYARIFVISTGGEPVTRLIGTCAAIPGFNVESRSSFIKGSLGERFGEVAKLVLYGGMEFVIFSVPAANKMGPLLKAFSTNLVGLIILAEGLDTDRLSEIQVKSEEVLSYRKVPAAYIFDSSQPATRESKEALSLDPDEPTFLLTSDTQRNQQAVSELFHCLIGGFLNHP